MKVIKTNGDGKYLSTDGNGRYFPGIIQDFIIKIEDLDYNDIRLSNHRFELIAFAAIQPLVQAF